MSPRLRMSPTIKDCAVKILSARREPMHYTELTKLILKQRPIVGATPFKSVYSVLVRSREFRKTGAGKYTLK